MKKKIIIILGAVILTGIIALVVYLSVKEDSVEVSTRKIEIKTIKQTVTASGKVQPILKVEISANVSGEIVELPVKLGQTVKKNDLMCALDSTRYKASRDQISATLTAAESQIRLAQANLEQSKRDLARVVKLHQTDLVSDEALEASQTQVKVRDETLKSAKDQLAQAEAGLRLAGDDLSKTVLRAPVDGAVIALNKEVGEIAMGSQFTRDIIMTIADLSAMELVVEVDENDIPDVQLGQEAEIDVDAFPKAKFHGSITEIASSAVVKMVGTQEETTSFEVTITLTGDVSQLRPGMSATAAITTHTKENVLTAPIQCLTMRDPEADPKKGAHATQADKLKDVLFKIEKERAKMTLVKTGISSEFDSEIEGDAAEGQEIACGPYKTLNKELKDGDLLTINNEAAAKEETK